MVSGQEISHRIWMKGGKKISRDTFDTGGTFYKDEKRGNAPTSRLPRSPFWRNDTQEILRGFNRVCRANINASAAIGAGFRIDYIFIFAFTNSFDRAFAGACAARDAFISNFVSHN
jgi:hypothetical protein